jgi:hypothetical protein
MKTTALLREGRELDPKILLSQIGHMNVFAISGGRGSVINYTDSEGVTHTKAEQEAEAIRASLIRYTDNWYTYRTWRVGRTPFPGDGTAMRAQLQDASFPR